MSAKIERIDLPVIKDPADFDDQSGDALERLIFNHRPLVLLLVALVTLVLGFQATRLKINASFEDMIPQSHPFIKNFFAYRDSISGLGNSLRIVVENRDGDIFDKDYLEVVREVNDRIYLRPGVDRAWMKSVWTPATRWTEITEEGYRGGPVMPFDYDGSPESVTQFRVNVLRAGLIGRLVGSDYKSSMIVVPLLERNPETNEPIDYAQLSDFLEDEVRSLQSDRYPIRIIGFAKLVGDLIDGIEVVSVFFAISALIATLILYLYTRDARSTALLVGAALLGVLWLLGMLKLCGYVLNPYSVLVPFLVFAIGLSHGAQKMNGIMQDVGRGTHRYVAARYTFRRLFVAGLTALLTNAFAFAVMLLIDIPAIRDLAITTSIGVLILIFTKLILIPVALSYIGVGEKAAKRSLETGSTTGDKGLLGTAWEKIGHCSEPSYAIPLVIAAIGLGIASFATSHAYLQIGDLDPGAPELRPDSRYNKDVAYINAHYRISGDQFAVITVTGPEGIRDYATLVEQDRLAWTLQQLPEVIAVESLGSSVPLITMGTNEGNPKWMDIPRSRQVASLAVNTATTNSPELLSGDAAVAPVVAYLRDHKAETLARVAKTAQDFSDAHGSEQRQFLLAAGSAGIDAATNEVVAVANYRMLALVYASVVVLCYITFRNWRAVIVALVPLAITSFLCEALMVALGIGIKVATLPVIALGVGCGVDYALYLVSVQLAAQRSGRSLEQAYRDALNFTGRVVCLVGITMGAGVVTWAWSPIKFQADMGILLAFMFIWNMIGALLLIPALSHFLLETPHAAR
ncbi:MAG: MMPL family transporter [Gammaproteobacteria bacterium]|nr:MMPL family transporter [Gammaproteobacteria bacterium]